MFKVDYLANHPSHFEEVAGLKYHQWRHTSPDRAWDVWLAEIRESAQAGAFPMSLLALESDELLGFVTLVQIDEKAGVHNGLWMITLYVKEAFRRQGIGSALIERCISEARRMGLDTLYLWTESRDLTSYYGRRGWQWIGADEVDGDDIMAHQVG